MLINTRSINKTALFHDFNRDEETDLACITETWVWQDVNANLSLIYPLGFGCPASISGRGAGWEYGATVGYRNDLTLIVKPVRQKLSMKCLYLLLGACDRVGLLLVYRPPR